MLIEISEMEKRNTQIDLGSQYDYIVAEWKNVWVELNPDYTIDRVEGDESEGEEFTPASSTMSLTELSGNKSEENTVVDLAMEVGSESNQNDIVGYTKLVKWERTIAERLSHSVINGRTKDEKLLYGNDILLW